MNAEMFYDAVSGIDKKFVSAADDTDAIRFSFKKNRARKTRAIGSVVCCAVLVIAAGWFGMQNRFGKMPSLISNDTITAEHLPTEPNETQSAAINPGVIPQETEDPQSETTQSPHETPSGSQEQPASTAQTPSAGNSEASTVTPENGTEPTAPMPETTDGRQAEPAATTDPPTAPEDEVVFHQLYTYVIVSSAFSDYRLGKAVDKENAGERLEDAAATGVYVHSDGTIQEDETLRCEIFALTGVDPAIAVCVRFIDRGKGLKTDRYYLLYHLDADLSAIEAY